jgi:integrase
MPCGRGELRALHWEDVDWSLGVIRVRRSFTHGNEGAPKSGKVRSVPLVDQAARALDRLSRRTRWTADGHLVFVSEVGDVLDESALRRRFYAALSAAGLGHLRQRRGNRKPLTFHDLRHSFGTLAIQTYPPSVVQAYMGHADLQTTMRYIHHQPQHDAASRLTELIEERAGCTTGAPEEEAEEAEAPETPQEREVSSGPGRTRTSDRRIMSPLL